MSSTREKPDAHSTHRTPRYRRAAGSGLADRRRVYLAARQPRLPGRQDRTCGQCLRGAQRIDDRLYFFVLEDDVNGELAGCCAIEAQVGREVPFYNYRLGTLAHSSVQLDLHRTIDTLFLSSDHTGDAEVCSLYLRPEYRRDRNGALLSKARWLFIAEFRDRFPDKVLAEMRGRFDENGTSAFWECLGSHFFPMNFNEADRLTGLGQKSFIGELMPKFPIYTPFLSEEARACIGAVHEHTRPALEMLKKEGLRWEGYIDIFDGGPTVEAYIDDVRAVRDSASYPVEIVDEASSVDARPGWWRRPILATSGPLGSAAGPAQTACSH